MLVISRKSGEYLVLGDDIIIKVLNVLPGGETGDKVKLAILAPDEVRVIRGEIFGTREELQQKMSLIQSQQVGKRAERPLRRQGPIAEGSAS